MPLGSQLELLNSSIRYTAPDTPCALPLISVPPLTAATESIVKLWGAAMSFWMPRPPLSWIELPRTTSPSCSAWTPAPPLFAIVLPSPLFTPPTKKVPPPTSWTPSPPFGSGVSPSAATPIRLPVIVVRSVPSPMIITPSAAVRYVPDWSAWPETTLPDTVTPVGAAYWLPIWMPTEFGSAAVPAAFVPMSFPWMVASLPVT